MRAALISLPPPDESESIDIAGKSLAERQMLFARQCGCEAVIAYGSGASRGAIRLRHMAEKAGMRFQVISNTHALPGAIRGDDSLLVFQPNMLPESRQALDLLRAEGERMLVVSAGPGASGGFERIDLDRAWGGVLTLPGKWLAHLSTLPEDAAPHAALLRIALQQKLPEARLDDTVLDDGRWMIVGDVEAAGKREAEWLRRHVGQSPITSPSRWLAEQLIGRAGAWLMERPLTRTIFLTLSLALLAGAIAAAWYEYPILAFVLLALASPVLESFLALSQLAVAPFGVVKRWPWLRKLVDAGLFTLAVIAIDSLWYRAVFPPFVLVVSLTLLDRAKRNGAIVLVSDRAVIAALIASLGAFLPLEGGIMLAGSVVLATSLLPRRAEKG